MARIAPILPFVLAALAAGALARDDDAHVQRFKQFLRDEIEGKWEREELSEMRVVMLRGFERHDVPEAAHWIMTRVLPEEKAGDVLREAVRVLGTYNNPDTVREMAEVFEKDLRRHEPAQALALLAFGAIKLDTASGPIEAGLDDRDPRLVVPACRAVAASRRIALRPRLEKLLGHREDVVRAAAADALGALGGDASLKRVFETFFEDDSQRVRYAAWTALRRLTLENRPCDPAAWEEVWKKLAETAPPEGEGSWGKVPKPHRDAAPAARFFGIPVLGDRICFVLDVSLDMANPWQIDIAGERKKPPEERTPDFFNVKTRWDLVRAHLKECLDALPEDTEIAFVFFSHEITPWPDNGRFAKNKGRTRRKLGEFLEEMNVSGSTAMYEALAKAWGFIREGDPERNFDDGCDTIVFVTDGRPTHGELKNRADRIKDEVWRVAVPRFLRVHTVGVHYHEYELLKAMAKDTGGLYVHAQQHGDTTEPQDLDFWPEKKKAFEEARKKR